jgi:uncharacterized membrane protein
MTITFGKKILFSLLLGFDLLANISEITHTNYLGISTILSFCTCILLPGFLISLILQIRKISLWENLLVTVGLSLAFLEFGGLLLNILLPLFGLNDPLAFQNLVIGFDIYVLFLFIFAWIRTKQITVQIQFPRHSRIEKVLYALPVSFPILATLGAIILNNGGSNVLTMILLGAIAFYILLLILLSNKISVDLYPYAIFFIGIACLFITSLRSWYISGHDIEREFYVFQLTNAHHLWNMAFYEDPYNACLSITILPAILANLLSIQDMYIYKVIFQILFATTPVLAFFIIKNYTKSVLAFLSAFLFIAFPTFFTDMALLNRQEIGFIFFGLVVYVMLKCNRMRQTYSELDPVSTDAASPNLTKRGTVSMPTSSSDISLRMRRILFLIFGICVVLSHYSTNFILLGSVIFIYTLTQTLLLLAKFRIIIKNTLTNNSFLSLPLIVILFGMTYFWNNLYTHVSGNHVSSVISEVVNSVLVHSNDNSKASDLSYSIFFARKSDPNQELKNYIQIAIQSMKSKGTDNNQFYSQAITNKYPIYLLPPEELSPTPLGSWLSSFNIPVFIIQNDLKLFSGYVIQISVFIGLLSIILFKRKKSVDNKRPFNEEDPFDIQFLLFCFSAIAFLTLITILPSLSEEYGVLRIFQQELFVLSLPILLGLSSIFFFVKEQKNILFTGIIIIFLFFNLNGFFSHLTGEYFPVMYLDNSGLYYDLYYVRKADVSAIVWLSENHTKGDPIETDVTHGSVMLSYGHIVASNELIPPIIPKNGYMFVQVSNNLMVWGKNPMPINTPKQFLDDNKNLIYSNGGDNIYR